MSTAVNVARIEDLGWITKDVYDKKHQEYADKLQLLEIELSEYRKADYDYQTTVATVISLARRAQAIFDGCSEVSEKRAFLNLLLQNPTVNGKKLAFTLASPFNLVLDLADVSSGSPGRNFSHYMGSTPFGFSVRTLAPENTQKVFES